MESESLDFTGPKIPRDYNNYKEDESYDCELHREVQNNDTVPVLSTAQSRC